MKSIFEDFKGWVWFLVVLITFPVWFTCGTFIAFFKWLNCTVAHRKYFKWDKDVQCKCLKCGRKWDPAYNSMD